MKPVVRANRGGARLGAASLLTAAIFLASLACVLSALALDANRDYFISFKSRAYTDPEKGRICLPRECYSYIKFHSDGKKRPLFSAGWGKEGVLKIRASPLDAVTMIDSVGTGVVEFTEFAAVPAADTGDFTCGEWVRQRPYLVVRLTNMCQWEEQGAAMGRFCDVIAMPSANAPQPPKPVFKVLADIEVCCGTKSVTVSKVPAVVTFSLHVERLWGFTRLYWLMTVSASGSFRGEALGLTGADAGEIRFDLVTAGLRPLPPAHKAGDVISLDSDGATSEGLGVDR